MKTALLVGIALAIVAGSATAGSIGTFSFAANATFLEQSANDNCSWYAAPAGCTSAIFQPLILDLTANNIAQGSLLSLTSSTGNICYYGSTCMPPLIDVIFSTTSTLLGPTNANRVTGAISSNPVVTQGTLVTPNTQMYFGGQLNGVSGNFLLPLNGGTMTVVVPTGALFLFVGIADSFYADNIGTAAITLADSPNPMPEPGTFALMLGGLGAGAFYLRRRAKKN